MSDTHQAEGEQQQEVPQFEDESTLEEMEEAKSLGWKSPAEWKGDPPKNGFKKAKDFLEHGRTVLPIVRSENAALKRELTDARKELTEFKAAQAEVLENVHRMSKVALTRQREQLKEHYEAVKLAAVEVGDKDAYRKADDAQDKALTKFDEEVADKRADKKAEGEDLKAKPADRVPEIDDWVDENKDWFNKNRRMTNYAITTQAELQAEGYSLKKSLEETLKEVKKRFPEHFDDEPAGKDDEDDTPKRKGSPVEGGGSRMGGGSQRTAWSRLPEEAKKQGTRFVDEDKLFYLKGEDHVKDRQKALERYAKDFFQETEA